MKAEAAFQDQTQAEPKPEEALPVCPHCGQDPAILSCRPIMLGGRMEALMVFCGNLKCRRMFTVIGVAMKAPEKPRIAVPS